MWERIEGGLCLIVMSNCGSTFYLPCWQLASKRHQQAVAQKLRPLATPVPQATTCHGLEFVASCGARCAAQPSKAPIFVAASGPAEGQPLGGSGTGHGGRMLRRQPGTPELPERPDAVRSMCRAGGTWSVPTSGDHWGWPLGGSLCKDGLGQWCDCPPGRGLPNWGTQRTDLCMHAQRCPGRCDCCSARRSVSWNMDQILLAKLLVEVFQGKPEGSAVSAYQTHVRTNWYRFLIIQTML